jgi:WD40 repeat protein
LAQARLLTAVEAVRTQESPQTVGALLSVLQRSGPAIFHRETAAGLTALDAAPGSSTAYATADAEHVWAIDLPTGAMRVLWTDPDARNRAVQVSPDGRLAAFTSIPWSGVGDAEIVVVDTATGEEAARIPVPPPILPETFAFLSSAELGVATTVGLRRYPIGSARPSGTVAWPELDPLASHSLQLLPDGRMLLLSDAGPAVLVDPADGTVAALAGLGPTAAASPNGSTLLTQPTRPGPVVLVGIGDPAAVRGTVDATDLRAAAFSPDGSVIAVADEDSRITIIDAGTLRRIDVLEGHSGSVQGLVFSPDGQTLWSAGMDGDLIAWDLGQHRRLAASQQLPQPARWGQATADGSTAVLWSAGTDWRSARSAAVDLAADRTLVPPLPTAPLTASAAAITPDGAMMVAATYSGFTGEAVLQRVALPTGDVLPEVAMPWFVIGLAVMQDSTSAIVHGQYGIARVDLASGEVALNRPLPPSDLEFNAWPYSAQLSPDGTKVSLIRGKQMLVLDTGTLEEVASWETGDYDYTYAAAWLGDAALAHGGSAGVVHIRSVPEGQAEAGPLDAAPGDVCALASDPAGAVMASLASDGSVLLWDVPSAAPIGEPMRARPDLGCGWLRFTGTGEAMLLQQFDASGALVTWPVDSPTLLARACALAGREPDQQQWRSWHGGTPQRPTCGDLLQTDLLRG